MCYYLKAVISMSMAIIAFDEDKTEDLTMSTLKKLLAVFLLISATAPTFAETISVTSDTLENAEHRIAKIAEKQRLPYKIVAADTNNRVYMTAVIGE